MKHFGRLVLYKAYTELKSESGKYYAGFLWWILEPIIFMATFYAIFGVLFKRGGENFVPSLLCGLTVWKWFASSLNQGSSSITRNQSLLQVIHIKKIFFPAASIISNTIRFLIVFSLLLLFLLAYGIYPSLTWSALPLVLLSQFIFIIGSATLASSIVPFLPDINQLIDKALTLLFFLSGVFFDIGRFPPKFQAILYFNPMAVIISSYRNIFLNNQWPDWNRLLFVVLGSIVLLLLAMYILHKNEYRYPKLISQ